MILITRKIDVTNMESNEFNSSIIILSWVVVRLIKHLETWLIYYMITLQMSNKDMSSIV